MSAEVVARYGGIHGAIHGDGQRNIVAIARVAARMLADRGDTAVTTADDVAKTIADAQAPAVTSSNTDVWMCGDAKVGVQYARNVLERTPEGRAIVVVSVGGPTPFTRRACEGRRMQFFNADALCVSIVDHALVPEHAAVDECPFDVCDLPRILVTDRVVQYYDWPVGTIVRIARVFGGHEPTTYYRRVSHH
jgi:DNA-directed RNA polymerase subunit H (RpoH/RPB5)